jgi:hypothetical protein
MYNHSFRNSSTSSASSTSSSSSSSYSSSNSGDSSPNSPTSSPNTSNNTNNNANSAHLPFEIECLLRLRDVPGIIKLYDFFEEATCFVIVMEKLNRSITLFDLANGKPFSFTQNILRKIFMQLIRINLDIFRKGLVHRDIKPGKIF